MNYGWLEKLLPLACTGTINPSASVTDRQHLHRGTTLPCCTARQRRVGSKFSSMPDSAWWNAPARHRSRPDKRQHRIGHGAAGCSLNTDSRSPAAWLRWRPSPLLRLHSHSPPLPSAPSSAWQMAYRCGARMAPQFTAASASVIGVVYQLGEQRRSPARASPSEGTCLFEQQLAVEEIYARARTGTNIAITRSSAGE